MRAQRAEGRAQKTALLLCALLSALCPLAFALDVPPAPTRWFTDRANLVTPDQATALDHKLEQFEQTSGAQFIIYVFPSLEGESMEDFTIRCVERWKVGQKKYDNGLVLFVFAQEKKIRVEVGYGLEGTITDAFSSRVIRDVMAPRFQARDYNGGLNAAADAVIAKITKGEEPVAPMQRPSGGGAQSSGNEINPIFVLMILFVVFFVILPMLSRRRRGGGGCGGCFPLFFFPGGGSGITFGGGGFSGGGGWGGGGGGFSGGGGGFGGGGASGGW